MIVHRNNSIQITLDTENRQLWIECMEAMNSEDFKEGLLKALELATIHQVRQWLIDARQIGELSEADESWIQINFFPQLMDDKSTCFIAMLISNNCYDRMLQESGWFGLKSYNTFIKINTFYNLQDAEKWLLSQGQDIEMK